MKSFFRVENNDHKGPYNNKGLISYLVDNKYMYYDDHDSSFSIYMSSHPYPDDDHLLRHIWNPIMFDMEEHEKYIFGFDSIEKVFAWFHLPIEIKYLTENNFHVSIYEVDDPYCHHGSYQSIANSEKLKLIEILEF